MPANVESAAYANTPAWHREGTVVDTDGKKGMTIEQALPASGLDWEVEKVPAYAMWNGQPVEIEGRYAVQRKTDGRVFGTVGGAWQPVQNIEGFRLVDDLIQEAGGSTWIEAAGALDEGRKVWVMVHLDNALQIAGEKYSSYLTFVNGHDGRTSVMAMCHDVRIVCQNTLAMAVGETGHTGRVIRVRHTVKAAERIKAARHILGVRNARLEELAHQGEWLVEQKMDDGEFARFLDSLMPVPEIPKDKDSTPAATMIGNRRGEISKLFFDAPNLKSITGTRWGALQAVVEYADHGRPFKTEQSQLKAQFGLDAQQVKIKDDAFTILKSPDLALA